MALTDVRNAVCFYLQQEEADFIRGGNDVLLYELNQARKKLEKAHDFLLSFDTAEVSLTSSGVNLSALTGAESGRVFKSPIMVWQEHNDALFPVKLFSQKGVFLSRLKAQRRHRVDWPERHLPDVGAFDGYLNDEYRRHRLLLRGTKLFIDPPLSEAVTLHVYFYTWLAAYTNYSATDFIVTFGEDYLKWEVISALNNRTMTFVDRQEGVPTISAIDKRAAAAAESVIVHDNFFGENGVTSV